MKQLPLKEIFYWPLSLLWSYLYALRRFSYFYGFKQRYFAQVPVISVGNLSFGGTGKTPLVLWLYEFLDFQLNQIPLIATRGYKGRLENERGMIKSGQRFRLNPDDYGDEPLMVANHMKRGGIVVGKERAKNIDYYFHQLNPDVIVLDDGFQHLAIHRSLDIVLIDATKPLSFYSPAPLGGLRENLSALRFADVIIFTKVSLADSIHFEKLQKKISPHLKSSTLIAEINYIPEGFFNLNDEKVMGLELVQDKKIILVSALAEPDSFIKSMENLGASVVKHIRFPDHYKYTAEDVNEFLIQANKNSAYVVFTEKDAVKIRHFSQDPLLTYLKGKIEFFRGQKEFEYLLSQTMSPSKMSWETLK
jgi:tetraacyldisaccharide 4'-kinase